MLTYIFAMIWAPLFMLFAEYQFKKVSQDSVRKERKNGLLRIFRKRVKKKSQNRNHRIEKRGKVESTNEKDNK